MSKESLSTMPSTFSLPPRSSLPSTSTPKASTSFPSSTSVSKSFNNSLSAISFHSPLLGWQVDGFAIYGINSDDGEPPHDLDSCGGHDSDSIGVYHYHWQGSSVPGPTATEEIENVISGYPYINACFMGCVPDLSPGKHNYDTIPYDECIASAFSSSIDNITHPASIAMYELEDVFKDEIFSSN